MALVKNPAVTSEELALAAVAGMQEKKGISVALIDLRKVRNASADFFVICSGNSDAQVDALATSVEDMVYKNLKERPYRSEGQQAKEWILVDYVNVVVHVFKRTKRDFYALEELWGDGKIKTFADVV